MSRRAIRTEAVKFLYAKTFNESFTLNDFLTHLTKIKKENEKIDLVSLINGILMIEQKLDSFIRDCAKEYEKLNKLDLSILKVGAYELIYTHLPKNIVINEAVEIAKSFGDDVSKAIVNAILECIGDKYER